MANFRDAAPAIIRRVGCRCPVDGTDRDGWSAQSVLLPYIEQPNLSATLNYSLTFDNASATVVTLADGTTVAGHRAKDSDLYLSVGKTRHCANSRTALPRNIRSTTP